MWHVWVKTFRDRHGMSQEAAAEMLGVDARTVRRWEAEVVTPRPETVARLRDLLIPSPAHQMGTMLKSLLELSSDYIILLDARFKVVANSQAHQDFMWQHHKVQSIVGLDWQKWQPAHYTKWLIEQGGTKGLAEQGCVSRRNPYIYDPLPSKNKSGQAGINDHSLMRLPDGLVHLSVTRRLQREDVEGMSDEVTLLR
jgi:transcriptional regulator with XRE-family HTH domain